MNLQTIPQKFQPPSSEPFFGFFSGSTFGLFMDYENIMSNQNLELSITNDTFYSRLSNKVYAFVNLQKNWDSYDADMISTTAIDVAIETLNHLYSKGVHSMGIKISVFPMRDGGIQFEFDGEYICAELEINQNGDLTFILFDDDGNIINDTKQPFELSTLSTRLEEAEYGYS